MEQAKNQNPAWFVLATLSSIPLIMVLGNSMLIPVLPTVRSLYHLSSFQVSLLITLFSISAAIVIPIAGVLADRIGRKKVIFYSLIIYGIGGLLAGIFSIFKMGFWFLLGSRILQGIGAAGTAPIAMVLVGDLYQKQQRSKALGVIEAANAMGKVLSPILGSLIAMITWYAMFFAFPALCVPAAVAVWFLIKEPAAKKEPPPLKEYLSHIKRIFKLQGKWLSVVFLAGAFSLFTMFGVLFHLSDTLENTFRIDGMIRGLILAIPLLALCTVAYFTGSWIKNKVRLMKHLIVIGLILMSASVALLPWTKGIVWMVAAMFVTGFGAGLILPCLNTLITSAVSLQQRGIITSLYGSIRFFGVAFGPPVFGALANRPFLLFLGTSAILVIITILTLIFLKRPQRIRGKEEDQQRILIRKKLATT